MKKEKRKPQQPFRFFECTTLLRPTGKKAQDLVQLLNLIGEVAPGVLYHHTHQYYLKASVDVPEYPNDFAVWAAEGLEERALAEKLATLDLYAQSHLEGVRESLIEIIRSYLQDNPAPRSARSGEEFCFNDAVTIVAKAEPEVETLSDFVKTLRTVGTSSIYFHFFEARLRLQRPVDDFSTWLETSLGRRDLARRIRRLDPYHYSLEGLRREILALTQTEDPGGE